MDYHRDEAFVKNTLMALGWPLSKIQNVYRKGMCAGEILDLLWRDFVDDDAITESVAQLSVATKEEEAMDDACCDESGDKNAKEEKEVEKGNACDVDKTSRRSLLMKETLALMYNFSCKKCREERSTHVLLPCGHLALCSKCVRICMSCPLCHEFIGTSILTYMS